MANTAFQTLTRPERHNAVLCLFEGRGEGSRLLRLAAESLKVIAKHTHTHTEEKVKRSQSLSNKCLCLVFVCSVSRTFLVTLSPLFSFEHPRFFIKDSSSMSVERGD